MTERWMRWHPRNIPEKLYQISEIHDDITELRLLLVAEDDTSLRIWVVYDQMICAYRSTDESFSLKRLGELHKTLGLSFYSNWTFFQVSRSTYIAWLEAESLGEFFANEYKHFVFMDENSIVDVVSASEPRFEFVTLAEKEDE